MKIAIVNWTDSAMHGTDNFEATDPILRPIKAVSVGVLVKQNKECVVIACDAWETGNYRNVETILRRQIDSIQIKELKLK